MKKEELKNYLKFINFFSFLIIVLIVHTFLYMFLISVFV